MRLKAGVFLAGVLAFLPSLGWTAEHTINAEARQYNPDVLYIQPGDTVQFVNMTSHDSQSVEGLIPEGAEPWHSPMGQNFSLTLNVEGIYGYVCNPHIGFGMMGVIVVGNPTDIDAKLAWAQENLQGPYRRLIAKLLKVQREAKAAQ